MHSPAHYRRLCSTCRPCANRLQAESCKLLHFGPAAAFHGTGGPLEREWTAPSVLRDVPGSELIELLRYSSMATTAPGLTPLDETQHQH